jgi:small GTP-binding protein
MNVADSAIIRGRVVLIGDASVGKTSILSRLISHRFDVHQTTTIGANYQMYVNSVGDVRIEIQIWDTAGQERFRSLGPIYYRNALAAVAVFDVANRQSFDNLTRWITSFRDVAGPRTIVVVVANKVDLLETRPEAAGVTMDQAREFATTNGFRLYETSALTGAGVQEVFLDLSQTLAQTRVVPTVLAPPAPVPAPAEQPDPCQC